MTRRASLPGAAELFRPTSPSPAPVTNHILEPATPEERSGTGRQKHAAKITVYVSDEELLSLEQARLALRAQHGVAVDRGRIVREAIAVILADLEGHGPDSMLVRRLAGEPTE